MARMGVFICWCGANIAENVDCEQVAQYASKLPSVVVARSYKYMCSDPGQSLITDAIQKYKLTGVVVASCSPRMHEPTFRKAAATVGLNPYMLEMANIREHCSWVHNDRREATEKAKDLIRLLVEKVRRNVPLEEIEVPVTQRVMVIGAGIAGIQAALDVAAAGYEVALVERNPSIGGHMAMLDETFPTLDCSQCILTPRMVSVGQHPKIKLYTYSEIEDVSGYVGNFKVKVKKRPRYVNEKCTSCDECTKVCPVEVPNEFDERISLRKAIYRPFPQAVPGTFTIDRRGIAPCKAACPAGTSVQGYVALIREGKYKEALELNRRVNPFPSVCGRVCTHPCETECGRSEVDESIAISALKRFVADWGMANEKELPQPVKKTHSHKVAIIGSGPAGLTCAYQLVKLGYPITVFEALPAGGGMMRVGIPDFRLPKDLLETEIEYIRALGVDIKYNTQVGKDIAFEKLAEDFDAVFVAVGAHKGAKIGIPGEESEGVIHAIDFLRDVNLGQRTDLTGKRVAIIGGGNAAIDASRTGLRLGAKESVIVYRRTRNEMPANDWEVEASLEEGVKIRYLEAPVEIVTKNGKVSAIKCIKMELGEPDQSGRRRPVPVEGPEFEMSVDIVIPAISQNPDLSFLLSEFEVTKWNTIVVDETTGATQKPGIFAGGDVVLGPDTIIKAIAHGNKVATSIDLYLRGEDMSADREPPTKQIAKPEIAGVTKAERVRMPELAASKRKDNFSEVELGITSKMAKTEAERCLDCGICSECLECAKVCEAECIDYNMREEIVEEEVGAIIVATGYELLDTRVFEEYGYGRYPDVITSMEFERMVSASGPTDGKLMRPSNGKPPETIVFLQCIGSRREVGGVSYCSKICCMYTAKHAILYKHKVHDGQAFVFYMDVRSGGKNYEEFVRRVVTKKIATYLRGRVAKIFPRDGKLIVRGADTLSGGQVEIATEMVVLAPALVPSAGVRELAQKLRIGYDQHGFLMEAHPKLRPVETNTAGVFLAGTCHSPQDIPDSVVQASATASKALGLISHNRLSREPTVGVVDELSCNGCFECENVCAYGAIGPKELRDNKGNLTAVVAHINEGLCQGCGACAVTCRSKSIEVQGFQDDQLFAAINAISW